MARLLNGIFGPVSGKIGGIIGSSWKGKPYIKSVSKSKGLKKKPSEAQSKNQAKFGFISKWLIPFHPYFTVGMALGAKHGSPISNGLKFNYREAFSGESPEIMINYEKLLISKGALAEVIDPVISWLNTETLELTWIPNEIRGTAYNDQMMLVLYSPDVHLADGFIGNAIRINGRCRFSPEPIMRDKPLHVYLSMVSLDRRRVANSQYLGLLEPFN